MKENHITTLNQIKGLALEKLKDELGLSQYLDSPPCSLSSIMYNPNINGIKNSMSFSSFSLSFPISLSLSLILEIGVQTCTMKLMTNFVYMLNASAMIFRYRINLCTGKNGY